MNRTELFDLMSITLAKMYEVLGAAPAAVKREVTSVIVDDDIIKFIGDLWCEGRDEFEIADSLPAFANMDYLAVRRVLHEYFEVE
jgi:hypothetical protein